MDSTQWNKSFSLVETLEPGATNGIRLGRSPYRMFRLLSMAALLVATPALYRQAIADVTTARISGIVEDSSGAALPGAAVVATDRETGIRTMVVSDGKGFYSFPALPVGTYRVEISKTGFKTYIQSDLLLRVNDSIRVDAILKVGDVAEHVDVVADAVHVETTTTQLGEVISDQKMEAVPLNGRSYTDLLALQAGVVA